MYYVRQNWDKSFKELIDTIQQHISDMEPEADLSTLFVWVDFLAINPRSIGQTSTDLMNTPGSMRDAKPTLICMQQNMPELSRETSASMNYHGREKPHQIDDIRGKAVLVLFRDRAGLRGFDRLRFDTVHMKYA